MNRLSAIDACGPAFARVGAMLFNPFRLKTWLKMGFIGLLGGGLVTFSSNFNFRAPVMPPQFPRGQFPNDPMAEIQRVIRSIHLADYYNAIVVALCVIAVLALVFLYLFCRFRFVLFDSVINGQPVIGRGWRQYAGQANRYFGFWLAFKLVTFATMIFIVGIPLWRAYQSGVFSGDNSVGNLLTFFASIALEAMLAGIGFAIVSTLMKDFIMPIMALDDFALGDAWTALWRVIASEPGAWAGYFGMKILLAIGAAIALVVTVIVAVLPAIVIVGIPVGLVALLGAIAFKMGAGALAAMIFVAAGLLAATGVVCLYLILIAPFVVFFASYAFYFFGGRYPKLGSLLAPQPLPPAPTSQMAGTPSQA